MKTVIRLLTCTCSWPLIGYHGFDWQAKIKYRRWIHKVYIYNDSKLKPRSHALIYSRCANFAYMQNLHPVYFWACERNCIYIKVNLHMCKYTPGCISAPAQTRCKFTFAYMQIYSYSSVYLVMWTRSKYTHVCKCNFSSYFKYNWQ